jgi:hypothetical protein
VLTARVFERCFCLFNRSFSPCANLCSCYLFLLTLQFAPALFFFERSSSPAFFLFVDLLLFGVQF